MADAGFHCQYCFNVYEATDASLTWSFVTPKGLCNNSKILLTLHQECNLRQGGLLHDCSGFRTMFLLFVGLPMFLKFRESTRVADSLVNGEIAFPLPT